MKMENVTLLPPEELFTAVDQLLQEGYDAEFTVTGNSMWPLLTHGRDQVCLRAVQTPLKKGDIVLLRARQGYLLHRITRLKNGMVQTTGDGNCYRDEFVAEEKVLGRVTAFTRKGKQVSCSDPLYKLSSWVWRISYPVRPWLRWLLRRRRRRT